MPSRTPVRTLVAVAAAATGLLLASGCGAADPQPSTTTPAASPTPSDDRWVWVATEGDDALSVIDAETGELVSVVHGVPAPHNVQGTNDGTGVWATSSSGVVQVDAATMGLVGTAGSGDHPAHVVGGPDGSVWVTSAGDGSLWKHAAGLDQRVRHDLGGAPHGMRVAADGSFVAVANTAAGTVDLVDLSSGDGTPPVRSVKVGPSPIQVAIDPSGERVYAAVAGRSQVVAVDVASGAVVERLAVPSAPAQVWVTAGGRLLSANQGTEADPGTTLSVIDTGTFTETARIEVGSGPHGVVADEDGERAWVTNVYDDSVSIVDLVTGSVLRTVPVGDAPNGITLTPAAGRVPVQVHLAVPTPGSGHDHDAHDHAEQDHAEQDDGGHDHAEPTQGAHDH